MLENKIKTKKFIIEGRKKERINMFGINQGFISQGFITRTSFGFYQAGGLLTASQLPLNQADFANISPYSLNNNALIGGLLGGLLGGILGSLLGNNLGLIPSNNPFSMGFPNQNNNNQLNNQLLISLLLLLLFLIASQNCNRNVNPFGFGQNPLSFPMMPHMGAFPDAMPNIGFPSIGQFGIPPIGQFGIPPVGQQPFGIPQQPFGAPFNSLGITPPLSSGVGSSVVNIALQQVGKPYVFGAEGPNAFDCSGLVQWSFKQIGKNLPRTADQQFHIGTPVSKNQLQPGDLVFFANTYKLGISHVGIYIGGGKFVHAANSRKGVIISSLSESYYAQHYAGAKRV